MYRSVTVLLLLVLMTGGSHVSTAQKNGVEAHLRSYISNFPRGITASLEVRSPQPVSAATFFVSMDGLVIYSYEVTVPPHNTGDPIQIEGRWDGLITSEEPSPPWGILHIWWQITDTTGSSFTTRQWVKVYSASNRPWQISTGVFVDAYTYLQDTNYGVEATRMADEGMVRLKDTYGYSLPYRPILVFYNSRQDGIDDLGYQGWEPFQQAVGARAFPGTNVMIALVSRNIRTVERVVLHEMAHLHQFQLGSLLLGAPLWWLEGDAAAQEPPAERVATLDRVQSIARQQQLPYLPTWAPATTTGEELRWITDVGASFVIFLESTYGFQSHADFYRNWRSTLDFHLAIEQTYGDPLGILDQKWRAWVATVLF